jgi:hypothetical protein
MPGKEIFTGYNAFVPPPTRVDSGVNHFGVRTHRANQLCANIGEQQISLSIAGRRSCTSLFTDLHEVIHA